MPRPVNRLQITGNATLDPKVLMIEKDGKPLKIANFSIAFDWWHGKKLPAPWYFNCVAFGYTAENVEKYIRKGYRVMITDSYIQPNKYKTKDGTTKETIKIMVNDFVMLGYNNDATAKETDEMVEEMTDDEIPY